MASARQGTFDPVAEIRHRLDIARKALERWSRRLRKALDSLADPAESLERAERAELLARTLLSHLSSIPKGSSTARLPDYGGDGTGTVEIPIDPAKGPRSTAEAMLHQSRKARRTAAMVPLRTAELEGELSEVAQWQQRLEESTGGAGLPPDTPTDDPERPLDKSTLRRQRANLEKVLDELETRLTPRGLWPVPPRVREAPVPKAPVRWSLDGGWILMAGRSGTENDFLTTRMARPDDLWFHVANIPGAHVILRSPDGKPAAAPRELVERAAGLAAWLSRYRSQERVEVHYTERRRVRKPRKAPAGTVVMDQSRSILVAPAPPPRGA